MSYDYDDYEDDYTFDSYAWEVRINNEKIGSFNNKENAIDVIIEELMDLADTNFFENDEMTEFYDSEELSEYLLNLPASDFYKYLDLLLSRLFIIDKIQLINLDNDEPEFGEL